MRLLAGRRRVAVVGVVAALAGSGVIATTALSANPPPAAHHYTIFSVHQDFGPYGIGGAWCGAPAANTKNEHWEVVGGGARFDNASQGGGFENAWPNLSDPKNPAWDIQANGTGGGATVYVVCIK